MEYIVKIQRAWKRYIGYLMGFCSVYFLLLDGGYDYLLLYSLLYVKYLSISSRMLSLVIGLFLLGKSCLLLYNFIGTFYNYVFNKFYEGNISLEQWFLNFIIYQNHLADLLRQTAGPHLWNHSVGLGQGPRICILTSFHVMLLLVVQSRYYSSTFPHRGKI